MASRFGFASLIPPGLEIDSVDSGENTLIVMARSNAATASCPLCGVVSHRVQSHYVRQPSDPPCAGRRVRLRILVRRFRCGVPGCLRKVFAERFDTAVLAERARRTGRLEEIVHHLGLALGGAAKGSGDVVAGMAAEGAGRVQVLPNASCCQSATTRCYALCVDAPCLKPRS